MKPYELTMEKLEEMASMQDAAHEAQKKMLEWLNRKVLYTTDGEISTGNDLNIMIYISPKQWQALLKDFGLNQEVFVNE